LSGLLRRGSFKPLAGWRKFLLQVLVANIFLAGLLWWGAQSFDWLALREHSWQRMGLLAGFMVGAMVLYFSVLLAVGVRPTQFARK
jgi:putative peptidoglycan lipid II flippase